MKHTRQMKLDGESFCMHNLSAKARHYVEETDPLTVYAYKDNQGEYKFDIEWTTGVWKRDCTFEEMQVMFEDEYDEVVRQEQLEEED